MIGFPAAALATNCFVVAPSADADCVIVDPGVGVLPRLQEVVTAHRLRPVAALLTHGHFDHTFSVTPVAREYGIPTLIHRDDRYRLRDPLGDIDAGFRAALAQEFGDALAWQEPTDVAEVTAGQTLQIAGLRLDVIHAPGHTEGSVLYRLDEVPDQLPADAGLTGTILAGDVLFSGGIGRTDLPGGDDAAMAATLRDVILAQRDDLLVFPGHGPATTIGRERAGNPYLQGL